MRRLKVGEVQGEDGNIKMMHRFLINNVTLNLASNTITNERETCEKYRGITLFAGPSLPANVCNQNKRGLTEILRLAADTLNEGTTFAMEFGLVFWVCFLVVADRCKR